MTLWLIKTLHNQNKTVHRIRVDEDGELAICA